MNVAPSNINLLVHLSQAYLEEKIFYFGLNSQRQLFKRQKSNFIEILYRLEVCMHCYI